MNKVLWVLPYKSQELNEGPDLQLSLTEIVMRFDWEETKMDLKFQDVEAFIFTGHYSCTEQQLDAYDQLIEVAKSNKFNEVKALYRGESYNFKHFCIFIDEIGCYDILARSVELPNSSIL